MLNPDDFSMRNLYAVFVRLGVGAMFAAVMFQSVTNVAFHGVAGRYVTVEQYGVLGAVLALVTLFAVPLGAVQAASAKIVAEKSLTVTPVSSDVTESNKIPVGVWGTLIKTVGVKAATLTAAGVFLLSALVLVPVFDLGEVYPTAAFLAVLTYASVLLAVLRGVLLGAGGENSVRWVAGSFVVSSTFRLAAGITAVAVLGWGVLGALGATVGGELAAVAVVYTGAKMSTAKTSGVRFPSKVRFSDGRQMWRTVFVVIGLFLYSTVDLFVAKYVLQSPVDAGGYVAAATIGKTVMALPAAAVAVLYPRMVQGWIQKTAHVFKTSTAVVAGSALLAAVAVITFPSVVLTIMYGDAFTSIGVENVVRLLAAIAVLSSLVSVFTYSGLARKARFSVWLPYLFAGVQVAGVWLLTLSGASVSAMKIAEVSLAAAVAAVGTLAFREFTAWKFQERSTPSFDLPRVALAATESGV